jgi:hypothetical protein
MQSESRTAAQAASERSREDMAGKKKKDATNRPTDAEIVAGLTLRDDDRSARGLGWEHCRRGLTLDNCPYDAGTWKQAEYVAGWNDKYKSDAIEEFG